MYAAKSGETASWLHYQDLLEARRRGTAAEPDDGERTDGADNANDDRLAPGVR